MDLHSCGACNHNAITITTHGNEQWNVEVYSAAGKLYADFVLNKPVYALPVVGWQEGLYFIAFKKGQYIGLQKFLVH